MCQNFTCKTARSRPAERTAAIPPMQPYSQSDFHAVPREARALASVDRRSACHTVGALLAARFPIQGSSCFGYAASTILPAASSVKTIEKRHLPENPKRISHPRLAQSRDLTGPFRPSKAPSNSLGAVNSLAQEFSMTFAIPLEAVHRLASPNPVADSYRHQPPQPAGRVQFALPSLGIKLL